MSNEFPIISVGTPSDGHDPDCIHVIGNAKTLIADDLQIFSDGIALPRWHYTPPEPITIDFTLTPECVEYLQSVFAKVSETFQTFIDELTRALARFFDSIKALEVLDLDWAAINAEIEAAEKAHARRFKMYQRRYARGKRK